MKTFQFITKRLLQIGLLFLAFACNNEEDPILFQEDLNAVQSKISSEKVNMFKGPEVQYGTGKARSWLSVNMEGFPVEIGVELTEKVFEDLQQLPSGHYETAVLPLHHKAKELTPFEHIALYYHPTGHAPAFFVEHLDFYFFTITNEERMAIPEYDPNNQSIVDAFNLFPEVDKMPSEYFKFPGQGGVYPQKGKHWLPKYLGPPPFSNYSFINYEMVLGTYAQRNNFIEPQVTINYILSGQTMSTDYPQPKIFGEPGNHYPTKYNVYHDDKTGNVYITLSNFVLR